MSGEPCWKTFKPATRKRKRLPPMSKKGRNSQADLATAKLVVERRSGGLCEAATPACPPGPHRADHVHHVLRRSHTAGHDPALMLHACWVGHEFIHRNVATSLERGWLRRSTDR